MSMTHTEHSSANDRDDLSTSRVDLANDLEVTVTRAFDAQPDLVFAAFTKPPLVQKWLLGPPGWSMPVCDIDFKVGGKYRYRWRSDKDGTEFGFVGTFKEIEAPRLIVHSEKFDEKYGDPSMPGETLVTTRFEKRGGRTVVTMTQRFESKQARDTAVGTGMTDGMEQSFKLLDQLLKEKN